MTRMAYMGVSTLYNFGYKFYKDNYVSAGKKLPRKAKKKLIGTKSMRKIKQQRYIGGIMGIIQEAKLIGVPYPNIEITQTSIEECFNQIAFNTNLMKP